MNDFERNIGKHRLAALAAGSVTSLALMSAVLLLFAGVEPQVAPIELAAQCGGAAFGNCEAGASELPDPASPTAVPPVR
jgi:hypothetical protein